MYYKVVHNVSSSLTLFAFRTANTLWSVGRSDCKWDNAESLSEQLTKFMTAEFENLFCPGFIILRSQTRRQTVYIHMRWLILDLCYLQIK